MRHDNLLSLHEAIIVVLINHELRTAPIWIIAETILKRKLLTGYKDVSKLSARIEHCVSSADSKHCDSYTIIVGGYVRLKDLDIDFRLRLWNAIEPLANPDVVSFVPKKLNVIRKNNQIKETIKIDFSPASVVSIVSAEKSRKKNIYKYENNHQGKGIISCYQFNNNEYNFEKLCNLVDPQQRRLIVISKSAIVNVAFYDLVRKDILKFNRQEKIPSSAALIKISDRQHGKGIIEHFMELKKIYNNTILFQKNALGYKTDMGF